MTKKEMNLEDLLEQTEQKITNKEYYEDCVVEYKDYRLHVRIRPISQARFVRISENKRSLQTAEFNTSIIHECVLNKHDNQPFTKEQINKLFTGGLAGILALKCCEISGIYTDKKDYDKALNF